MGDGIYIQSRQNADLFTVAHFRAKTKTTNILARELLFADDSALIAHSAEEIQWIVNGSNDSRLHVVEPPRGRSFIWQIGVNSFIQDRRQVDLGFYGVESVVRITLTHYSTEPLTTGPNYDPLLLLLALSGDVHPNPGQSR